MTYLLCEPCRARHLKHPDVGKAAAAQDCYICQGLLEQLERLADEALGKAAASEWDDFCVQTTFPRQVMLREEDLWDDEAPGETMALKNQLNRLVIDYLEKRCHKPYNPSGQMQLKLDFNRGAGLAMPTNLYVFGHYLKKSRQYCQHDWACSACRGRGCKVCNFHKQNYPSIEGAVRGVLGPAFGASDGHLHASGREDVDVLMLGSGRPFVFELVAPKKRTADLNALAAQLAATHPLEVKDLAIVSGGWVEAVCHSHFDKHYRATVKAGRPLTDADWQKVMDASIIRTDGKKKEAPDRKTNASVPLDRPFAGPIVLNQRTPTRVAARRSDLIRKRRVYEIKPVSLSPDEWVLDVYAEAGTYIKELVHGDDGRTVPSISSIVGTPCQCTQLDVIGIEDIFLKTMKKK